MSTQLSAGVAYLLTKNGVDVIWGQADLIGPDTVEVCASPTPAPRGALGPGRYSAPHIILVTGAPPVPCQGSNQMAA